MAHACTRSNIALFLRDLFELMDRGYVCSLVERVLNTLTQATTGGSAPPVAVVCDLKCDFLRLIAEVRTLRPVDVCICVLCAFVAPLCVVLTSGRALTTSP